MFDSQSRGGCNPGRHIATNAICYELPPPLYSVGHHELLISLTVAPELVMHEVVTPSETFARRIGLFVECQKARCLTR